MLQRGLRNVREYAAYNPGMRYHRNRAWGQEHLFKTLHHPLMKLYIALTTRKAHIYKIFHPRIDHLSRNIIPALHFPFPAMDLLKAFLKYSRQRRVEVTGQFPAPYQRA